jgi:hypothetical protein
MKGKNRKCTALVKGAEMPPKLAAGSVHAGVEASQLLGVVWLLLEYHLLVQQLLAVTDSEKTQGCMLDRHSAAHKAGCTHLGEGLPLVQKVQQLGDYLQETQSGLFCSCSLLQLLTAEHSARPEQGWWGLQSQSTHLGTAPRV